jgi:CheY-like chemotaxis protein
VRVLIVDDDPDYRMMLRMQLEIQHRLEVVGEASDGNEALAFLDHTRPDAMVLDLMMPGMDGYETIVHVAGAHPDLPVVAYTAVTGQLAQEHCQKHGIPLLRKSGNTTTLVETLRRVASPT